MPDSGMSLQFDLDANLNLNKVNSILRELKSSLGPLGTNIKELDASKLEQSLKHSLDTQKELNKEVRAGGKTLEEAGGKTSGLKSALQGIGNIAGGNLMANGIMALGNGFKDAMQKGIDFQASLADFSALTGVSGDALKKFGEDARNLSKEFGGSAIDQVTAMKGLLSRLGPDIAKSPEALNSMTRSINTLSKAGGLDAAQSMDALTTAMLQFGINLDDPKAAAGEMTRIMNIMAAGAKEGAAEIPQVSEALKVSGVAAKQANLSIEETNAAIQVLATGGKMGAEAGTALRNVLGKMAGADVIPKEAREKLKSLGVNLDIVTNKSLPLEARLKELGKASKDATAFAQVFGTENAAAAAILAGNSDKVADFTQKLTGTKTATEQASINMNTFAGAMDRFKAMMESIGLDLFNALSPVMESLFGLIGNVVQSLQPILQELFVAIGPIIKSLSTLIGDVLKQLMPVLAPVLKVVKDLMVALQPLIGALAGTISETLGAILSPLGEIFTILAQLISAVIKPLTPLLTTILKLIGSQLSTAVKLALIPLELMMKIFGSLMKALFGGKDAAEGFSNAAKAIGTVVGWASGLLEGMYNWIGNIVNGIKNFVSGIGDALNLTKKDYKAPINPNFKKDIKEAIDEKKKLGEAVPDAGINLGGDVKEKTKKKYKDIADEIQKVKDETAALLSKASTKELEAGRDKEIQAAKDASQKKLDEVSREIAETKKRKDISDTQRKAKIAELATYSKAIESDTVAAVGVITEKYDKQRDENLKKLADKLRDLEAKKQALAVKMGIALPADYTTILTNELKTLNDESKAIQDRIDASTSEDEKAKLKLQLADKEADILEKEEAIYNEKKKIAEEGVKKLEELNAKELEDAKETLDKKKNLQVAIIQAGANNAQNAESEALKTEMSKLDKLKSDKLISDEAYSKRKEELEKTSAARLLALKKANESAQLEAERLATLETLKEQLARKKAELDLAKTSGASKEIIDTKQKDFDNLKKLYQDQTDIFKTATDNLQKSLAEGMSTIFEGDTSGMKEGAKNMFAQMAGILKQQASLAIANLVINYLWDPSNPLPWYAKLLAIPAIKGIISSAVNALVDPIVSSVASFSTGGRVDSPTFAMVGDASRSRAGADTEWIFRDDQIKALVQDAIAQAIRSNISIQQHYQQETVDALSMSLKALAIDMKAVASVIDFSKVSNFADLQKAADLVSNLKETEMLYYQNRLTEAQYNNAMLTNSYRMSSLDSLSSSALLSSYPTDKLKVAPVPYIAADMKGGSQMININNTGLEAKLDMLISKIDNFSGRIHILESDVGIASNNYNSKVNRRAII